MGSRKCCVNLQVPQPRHSHQVKQHPRQSSRTKSSHFLHVVFIVYALYTLTMTSIILSQHFRLSPTRLVGKIFFWHYSIKIIGNFLICFLLLNWFFSIKSIRSFSNRKMSIINRKNSIKFQNIWQNSICYKALCCQKVKVQNWSSWLSGLWFSL